MVKLFEWFEDMKKIYMVFEYCEGGDLYEMIYKFGRIEERQAARMLYQIVLGLNYMHSQRICHRDIKADNCMFLLNDSHSPVKLIDFGLAIEYADPSIGFVIA